MDIKKRYLVIFYILFFLKGLVLSGYSQEDREHILNPGDTVEINVYDEPDLYTVYCISQDGFISFPLLGKIRAEGLTVSELERLITQLLAQDYLVHPQVRVFVKEYAKITISGFVRTPGSYELKKPLTLVTAIALAGGCLPEADTSKIKLVRIKDGKSYTQQIDMEGIINNTIPDVFLMPNDTIIVEEYGRVSIIGQVRNPGTYSLRRGLTLMELISMAGGFTEIANIDGTSIVRAEANKKKIIRVKISDIIKRGDKTKDVVLQVGDTVVVPESLF
ncbi:MAG: SLBB domain-containing protein [Candidatus Omnitrophica bacterium]|nr:SLBB domain-containing protein [Candidatus Omnitrophota bacterium]